MVLKSIFMAGFNSPSFSHHSKHLKRLQRVSRPVILYENVLRFLR